MRYVNGLEYVHDNCRIECNENHPSKVAVVELKNQIETLQAKEKKNDLPVPGFVNNQTGQQFGVYNWYPHFQNIRGVDMAHTVNDVPRNKTEIQTEYQQFNSTTATG